MIKHEIVTDVTTAVGLGERIHTVASVIAPDRMAASTTVAVCFAFPGGAYSRGYFTFDMPGSSGGGQAGWHAQRGWVFVACTLDNMAAANAATVANVMSSIRRGELPPVPADADIVLIGLGQSLGGCLLVVQQGQHETFDGLALLGVSAVHNDLRGRDGYPASFRPVLPRGQYPTSKAYSAYAHIGAANDASANGAVEIEAARADPWRLPDAWLLHHQDEPADIVLTDMFDRPARGGVMPEWGTPLAPPVAAQMVSAGVIAHEASLVSVPVFLGVGQRDIVPDLRLEPRAYENCEDITLFRCPRMAHMHNFAPTREELWARIHAWGESLADLRRASG
jgi:hypothetical protein